MRCSLPVLPSGLLTLAGMAALVSAGPAAAPLSAQCATAVLSTPGNTDFGAAVAMDGDRALVGEPSGAFAGAAWLVERGPWTWHHAAEFLPQPGTAGNARFGAAVALAGEHAAVGAPGEAGAAGAVYLFRNTSAGWELQSRLLAPDAAPGAEFGTALVLDGQRLAVGAPQDDQAGNNAGAVYLYGFGPTGWQPEGKLLGADALPGDGLGGSIALEEDLLAAGSRAKGLIWVYEHGPEGFLPETVLAVPGAGMLGQSLSLHAGRLLAGAPSTSATGVQSGAAHLFERTGDAWGLATVFVPPEPLIFARYGAQVRLGDALAVISAPAAKSAKGALYTYRWQAGAWVAGPVFQGLTGPEHAGLGSAFDVSGDVLVAGATMSFGPPGVAYVLAGFRPWQQLGGSVAGAAGAPALVASGSLCGGSDVTLLVSGGPPSAPVLYVVGFSELQVPHHEGAFWPAPDLLRISMLDAGGTGTLAGPWPIAQPGMQPVYVQAWVADASAPGGLTATGALRAVTP
jgi:hypothetical protein